VAAASRASEPTQPHACDASPARSAHGMRARGAWLRLAFQADYRQPSTKFEVNAATHAGAVVVTEEQRAKLIEKLRRVLEAGTTSTQAVLADTHHKTD